MPTIMDLYKIHLRQLDLTLAESDLLLQKEGGLDGEMKSSGSMCEHFMRQTFIKYIVPNHFRVTSGYIATPSLLAQKKNLPQCDILLADNHIPPIMRLAESSIEVIPMESVIGLIEAKRTLSKASLSDALNHLAKVIDTTGRTADLKTDKLLTGFNKYAGFHNYSSNKPLIGVVALRSGMRNFEQEVLEVLNDKKSIVDFVWTLDGFAMVPGFKTSENQFLYYTHTARPETKTWTDFSVDDFRNSDSEFYKSFAGVPAWIPLTPENGISREAIFSKIIGLTSLTISRIFPEGMREKQISDYYLSAQ